MPHENATASTYVALRGICVGRCQAIYSRPLKIGDTVISTYEDNISRQITEVIDVKYAIQYMPLYPGEQEES